MKLTVIPQDKSITLNGVGLVFDVFPVPSNEDLSDIHCIFHHDGYGFIDYKPHVQKERELIDENHPWILFYKQKHEERVQELNTPIILTPEQQLELQRIKRQQAYMKESDPLFFKWQRGEATEQEWLDKIQEIKNRFPTE